MVDDFPEWEPCHRAILSKGIYGFENVGGDLGQGHRQARHLRRVPVALGRRRRLHRAAGGDRRSHRQLPPRDGSRRRDDEPHAGVAKRLPTPLRCTTACTRCGCRATRPGRTERFWVGLSRYRPGGVAEKAPAQEETVYVLLDGELVVTAGGKETVLGRLDSMHSPGVRCGRSKTVRIVRHCCW